MTSKEVSQLLGIAVSAIHYYESEGLLTPSRSTNNYRDYSEKDIKRLKMIIFMKKMNFTSEQIKLSLSHYFYMETSVCVATSQTNQSKARFYLERQQEFEKRVKEYQNSIDILKKVYGLFQMDTSEQMKEKMIVEIDDLVNQFWKEGLNER